MLLVPPGDASAAAAKLLTVAHDQSLRERITRAAAARVRRHTIEAKTRRVAEFIQSH